MYFNPRIEAWLYKITNTTSPEYKSDLHASNGKNNGYSEIPTGEKDETKVDEEKTDISGKENTDDVGEQDEKETSADETDDQDKKKEAKHHRPFEGNYIFMRYFNVRRPGTVSVCLLSN